MNIHPILPTHFTNVLVRENELHRNGFANWVLHKGMEFGTYCTWWGDKRNRTNAHEGIDLCFYSGSGDRIYQISPDTKIPATHAGVVRKMFNDFLGITIVLEHTIEGIPESTFLSVYGHTEPVEKLGTGTNIRAGEIIARLGPGNRNGIPEPHLHLTFAYVLSPINYDDLDWSSFNNPDVLNLIDPQGVIGLAETPLPNP
ncbi:MAG TPA: peptidoglycan DD-metalloendopeptidase family protein [Syntrophorhabdaceae bacterium]|nr:peptidoglycan DD-metalloendopeptidase family protein [Syntrophorhabdaceae bacterium]